MIYFLLGFVIVISLGLYGYYKKPHHYKEIRSSPLPIIENISNNNEDEMIIENEDEFIILISKKYKTYEDFLKSVDFNEYFTFWNNHKECLAEVKRLIEKPNNQNTFQYKSNKY